MERWSRKSNFPPLLSTRSLIIKDRSRACRVGKSWSHVDGSSSNSTGRKHLPILLASKYLSCFQSSRILNPISCRNSILTSSQATISQSPQPMHHQTTNYHYASHTLNAHSSEYRSHDAMVVWTVVHVLFLPALFLVSLSRSMGCFVFDHGKRLPSRGFFLD